VEEQITRRRLLEGAAKGGFALGAGGLIAACGSSATKSKTSTTAAVAGKPRYGGTLHGGFTGGSSSDTIDPNSPVNNLDYARVINLYDPLVWMDRQGLPYLRLAEEMTPNRDATVWTIRLRKGVLFHDGKELTADDLIFSIKRTVNPKNPGAGANTFHGAQISAIRKLDRYTIALPFAAPYSTFLDSLPDRIFWVVPEGFDPKKPIGTGPFKYVSFTPGQQSVFVRWEHYWDQPYPYADTLILSDYSDQTSQVNALLSGEVNLINLLSQDVIGTVTGGGKKIVISDGGGFNPFTMRVDQAPFNDVRVRQAFRLMVNRPKMLDIVFGGHGTIGNDIFGIWDPAYDHALPQRVQDIEQAKHLLKAAGHDGLTVELVTSDIAQGVVNMAQVFVQDAAQAGVTVNLRQVTPTEFYGPSYLKWVFAQDYWYYNPYYPQVQQAMLPTAPFNECHFDDPRYNKLYAQALASTDEAKRIEIAHEMQMIDYTEGGYIIPFFPPVIDGFAPNVGGVVTSKVGISFNQYDFKSMWLT
jgi:peptide/nickel transport system substrate-binding protein